MKIKIKKIIGDLDFRVVWNTEEDLQLLSFITVVFDCDGKEYTLTACPGSIFNGASIPWFFWRIIGHPKRNEFLLAALFHDLGYMTHFLSKELFDELFQEILKHEKVWIPRTTAMFLGVHLFGKKAYKKAYHIDNLKYLKITVT